MTTTPTSPATLATTTPRMFRNSVRLSDELLAALRALPEHTELARLALEAQLGVETTRERRRPRPCAATPPLTRRPVQLFVRAPVHRKLRKLFAAGAASAWVERVLRAAIGLTPEADKGAA